MLVRRGFTLVELMIVVAIAGILSAVAVSYFGSFQMAAKRAELPANVDGIRTAQMAYEAIFDTYVEEPNFVPQTTPSKQLRPWVLGTGFDTLGWAPDGEVRGAYKVVTTSSTDFQVTGFADMDGDYLKSTYTATKSISPTMVTLDHRY